MVNTLKSTIISEEERYFAFCEVLDSAIKEVNVPDTYYYKSVYTCFNGFSHSLLSYLLSVYDDLDQDDSIMPKANANRILLRNCLEANLILNVLQNHPTYAEKFYATLQSDIDRIKETYNVLDQTQIDLKKYMKRFSWLPRIKGKKCTSLKDVLHFVDFDNYEIDNFYYNTLIKNFDTFIHPSFKFAEQIRDQKLDDEIKNISCLFISNGIIFDCCYNLLSNLQSVYEDKISDEVYKTLNDILKTKEFHSSTHSIKDAYRQMNNIVADYVHTLPSSLINLAQSIEQSNYKNTNISYLLFDLSSHYDDLLVSYYTYDIMMFYAQARYVIESLSLIHCLYRDDEERNYIYYLHQNIKSHDAKISALNFLNKFNLEGKEDPIDVNNIHIENIEKIRSYYRNNFNKDVEDMKITRLNGWALYLKEINNENVPNSPFFVELLGRELINNKEVTHYLLGFYEESNAFTHITPYAFDPSQVNFDLKKPLLLINELLKLVATNIISFYDLRHKLNNKDLLLIDSGIYYATTKFSNENVLKKINK